MNKYNQECVELIKYYESLHDGDLSKIGLQPKMSPAGVWTIGYGHALTNREGKQFSGEGVKKAAYKYFEENYPNFNVASAENLLNADLTNRAGILKLMLRRDANNNQFGAMLSLMYNIGNDAFKHSSVLFYFNEARILQAADSFRFWIKQIRPDGYLKVLNGLTLRREKERELFLKSIA